MKPQSSVLQTTVAVVSMQLDFVITADESCMHNYNLSFMAGFLSCVPRDKLPNAAKKYLEKKFYKTVPNKDGVAEIAILALRKIEAALLDAGFTCVVAPPQKVLRFDAKFYMVSAMDPFGIGPATTVSTCFSRSNEPFNKFFFERLVTKIRRARPNAKIIVGGPGAWEFDIMAGEQERLGIDCVWIGAIEGGPLDILRNAMNNAQTDASSMRPFALPKIVRPKAIRPFPSIVRGAAFWGMTEISRGCGRGCQFCDFELMSGFEWLPIPHIMKEAAVQAASPLNSMITMLSEDTIRYGTPRGSWKPTGDIVNLVKGLSVFGKKISFTHCCLATALANPRVTEDFSYYSGLDEKNLGGFQTGIESGSPRMVQRYMQGKLKPWKPEDWPEVVDQGMAIMVDNYIIPYGTLVVGLPGEATEDVLKTIELVDSLKKYPSLIMPLFFVPLSVIKDRPFLADMLSEEQKDLLIAAASHTARWGNKLPKWSGQLGGLDSFLFAVSGAYILESFKAVKSLKPSRWGVARRLTKISLKYLLTYPLNSRKTFDDIKPGKPEKWTAVEKMEKYILESIEAPVPYIDGRASQLVSFSEAQPKPVIEERK